MPNRGDISGKHDSLRGRSRLDSPVAFLGSTPNRPQEAAGPGNVTFSEKLNAVLLKAKNAAANFERQPITLIDLDNATATQPNSKGRGSEKHRTSRYQELARAGPPPTC